MAVNTMNSPKPKANSSETLKGQVADVTTTRMAALEARVKQLELLVMKLQCQLQATGGSVKMNGTPEAKPPTPTTPKKQKSKSPVKAAVLEKKSKPQGESKEPNQDTPTKQKAKPQVKAAVLEEKSKPRAPTTPTKQEVKPPVKAAVLQEKGTPQGGPVKMSVTSQVKPTAPITPKKQKAKPPVKEAVLQELSKPQGGSVKTSVTPPAKPTAPTTPTKQKAKAPVKAAVPQEKSTLQDGSIKMSVTPQANPTAPSAPTKQEAKAPAKAAVSQEKSKPQGGSKEPNHDTPTKQLTQHHEDDLLVDITPKKEDVQPPPPSHSTNQKKASVVSSSAFVRVSGPMGGCEDGKISTAVDHFSPLQLNLDANNASLWISSSLYDDTEKIPSSKTEAQGREFFEMGAVFRSAQIVPDSLQFGRVIDAMLLPSAILDQLDDPNEVPANLYFMSWKYHGCGADGFEQFLTYDAKFSQRDSIMKLYRQIFGHRQTVHVWFMTEAKHVEENLEWFKARCFKEAGRDWQACSGHAGKQGDYCPQMGGKNRKGVVKFLEQSAPPL